MRTKGPNVKLLRRLATKLRRLRHEEHYEQSVYGTRTSCGTAACIAGHVVVACGFRLGLSNDEDYGFCFARRSRNGRPTRLVAAELLGLSLDDVDILFSPHPSMHWPEPFRSRWHEVIFNRSTERPSRIAADYLDHLADEAAAKRHAAPKRKKAAHA